MSSREKKAKEKAEAGDNMRSSGALVFSDEKIAAAGMSRNAVASLAKKLSATAEQMRDVSGGTNGGAPSSVGTAGIPSGHELDLDENAKDMIEVVSKGAVAVE